MGFIEDALKEWKIFWHWSYIIDYVLLAFFFGLVTVFIYLYAPSNITPFRLNDPSISYPLLPETVSVLLLVVICGIPPLLVFIVAQYWFRSWHDLHHAILGFLETLVIFVFVAEILKKAVGALRPDFLARCQPGLNGICTGAPAVIAVGRNAFPSGHAGFAFGAYSFLAFYLIAKFKPLQKDGYLHQLLIILACFMIATWITITRVTNFMHTWGECIAGAFFGVLIAASCYFLHYHWIVGAYSHVPKLRSKKASLKEILLGRSEGSKITYDHVKAAMEFQEQAKVAYFQQVEENQRLLDEIMQQGETVRQLLAQLNNLNNRREMEAVEVNAPTNTINETFETLQPKVQELSSTNMKDEKEENEEGKEFD